MAAAYLVAWRDQGGRGRIVDVGIYSESSPTILLRSDRRTECLMSAQSRYMPGDGGYERARARVEETIARTPELHWVYGMPTYRRMQQLQRTRCRMAA